MSKKIIPKLLATWRPSRLPKKNDKYDSLNKSESIESKVSTAIMNLAWIGKLKANRPSDTDLTRDGGVALRTYLLNREDLKKEFLNAGYIEGKEGDYGLVRKAVGNRDIPIYQREPDAAKREDLVPIGNINNRYFPDKGELFHARNFPTALYYNYQNGKFYLKAWDLNDYGGSTGHTPLLKFGANVLDMIGSPTVITSGFLEISNDTLREYHKTLSPFIKKFFKSKGLIYDYLESTDVNPTIYLPEVTITGKNRNKLSNSNYNSDLIYIEGIGLVNKAKRTFQKGGRIDRENYIPNLFNEGGYIKENNNYINGYVRDLNNHPISFDTEGNLIDLVSGEKGTMMLPGFTVRGINPKTKAKNYSTSFDGTYGLTPRDVYGMMPVVGDALDIKDIGTDLYNGNYINAGIGAGLFLLPNVIEKPFKFAKSLYKGYKTNKTIKAARKAFDKSGEKLEVDAFKSGSKPMYVTPSKGPGSDHINIISNELKDSKYFDLERPFGKDKTLTLRYYINEGKLKQIIGTYKDFYKDRLGLYTNDVDKIYNHIISNPKLLDLNINSGTTGLQDIIGVSLGYGPKDAILFKIGYNGLNTGEKVSKDAIKSLKVFGYDKTLPGIYNILKKNIERGTLGVKSTTINGGHVGFGYVKNKFGGKFIKLVK